VKPVYVEGQNVAIEYRWAEQNDRLPALAAELVRQRVAVIATPGGTAATLAAKAATATIPIVFSIGTDPVKIGLVASLNRPGGNATGISDLGLELGAKRLGLLHELLPGAARFGVLVNPDNPFMTESIVAELQTAASAVGRQIEVVTARTNGDIDMAFATLVKKRADALLVSPDPLFVTRRVQLITLAVRHTLPALYHRREFAEAGGLMSYGSDLPDQFRQTGVYAGRILKGEKPAEMPVQLPTKFEFLINLQTARVIGLDISPMLLARADEVIE
jgi:putative ABC transport system substrate-binding protein